MNDEELKKLWQQQPLEGGHASPEQFVAAMRKQTTHLRSILYARDLRELAACAFVAIIFGIFYFTVYRTPVSRLGDLIVIGSSLFIAWKMIHTRRKTPPAPPGATVVESLRAELNAVRAQSQLLASVHWWYLLPLGLGILVCTWGSARRGLADDISRVVYTIFVIGLYGFIYSLNQRARATQLLPVEAQLESLIHSVETGEPPDERQVANLRPIVLSLSSANDARPVEFKVGFWQLAIYGVPGFVGIWFFAMLALTLDKTDWSAHQWIGKTNPPMVRSEAANETNRYFIVAQKLVTQLNAGDYAAVQELYNGGLRKLFSPKETTNFYTKIANSFGKIETFDGPSGNGYQGWPAFHLHYERGEMTMSLALDRADRISGIYFQPISTDRVTIRTFKGFIKAFTLELVSWRHLLWGVLSLLGGLIYTWLIQKTVRRAVGISTLGVHLQNGNRLILWDEIQEVRPFRFLNIQNLWLITDSGERARMHWSPLERHSDVKAAVEKFAPRNHLIRKHLSLLRSESSTKTFRRR